jgi:hypothetical protein
MQPIYKDKNGKPRFRGNAIVSALLDEGGLDLNKLALRDFAQNDWEQFYQLIGYSVNGYHELSRVSDASAIEASQKARDTLGIDGPVGCRDDGCEIHSGVEVEK